MEEDNKTQKVDYHALKKAADAQAKSILGNKDVRFDVMSDGTFRRMYKGKEAGVFTARALKSGLEARGINDSFLKSRRDRKRQRTNITNNQGFDFGVHDDNDDFSIGTTGGSGGGIPSELPPAYEEKDITICENGQAVEIKVVIKS